MKLTRVLRTTDEAAWNACLATISRSALVHRPRYTRVYERYGDGAGECFVYESDGGIVLYPFLRRPIFDADGWTDIITPYGYGGIAYACHDQHSAALIAEFRAAFVDYARETRTVSEFVRFHPFLGNHAHFHSLMDEVSLHCVNALTDLSVGGEALFKQYRGSHQTCIHKAREAGLRVVQLPSPDFIDCFFDLYSASMERKHQEGYVKFRRDFLVDLSEELTDDLKCFAVEHEGAVIAVALFQYFDGYLDYFLAASNPDMLPLHPNHLMLHEVALWGIEHGARWFHLGGGHKSLQFFKHSFANRTADYFVGKHVFDKDAYQRLSSEYWARHGRVWTPSERYFPGYRAEFNPG
ncbi:MAG: hypothetical protein JWN71_4071 [Xanthobacteraceae bacterium]|nr:hypothetical protein [Xanthobacteraceae bacterium]